MDELEFYDGLWDGPQIDAGITLTNTLADALAVVIDGNKTPLGATTGQYVLVRGSTISGVADGLYRATKVIPAATAIDQTYLVSVTGGGLNDLLSGDAIPRLDDHALPTLVPSDCPVGLSYMFNSTSEVPYYGLVFTFNASAGSTSDRGRIVQIGIPRQGMSQGTTKGLYVRIAFDNAWSPWTFISGTSV